MEYNGFKNITGQLNLLSESQLRKLKEKIQRIEAHHSVSKTLETKRENVYCPHCYSKEIVRWGQQAEMQRYKCKMCRKTFNALTRTPLSKLRRRGHWWDFCECLIRGYSLRKTANICDIDLTTAFRWRHRFLHNHASYNPTLLAGIVEVDIATIPTPRRNKDDKVPRKKTSVLFSMDRYKNTFDNILHSPDYKNIKRAIQQRLASDSLICTNSDNLRINLAAYFNIYGYYGKKSPEISYTYK
ncbi:MAG TPA: IS1 family transposase, partial [Bacteroidales bacterium]|nr:IS1 family transposase [Bacteroidales bacterium]